MKKRHNHIPTSHLLLLQDEKVLLLRRFNTGFEDGNYSLVAGHVEPGETFTDCVIREAREEAGIKLNPESLSIAHFMHRNGGTYDNERADAFFIAKNWDGEIVNNEPHKCDDLSWFHLEDLPSNMVPYIKQALEHIKENKFYSEHGW